MNGKKRISVVASELCLLALASTVVSAAPTVIFERLPDPLPFFNGLSSYGSQRIADDFYLENTAHVQYVHFWGFDAGTSYADDFTFTFYDSTEISGDRLPDNELLTTAASVMAMPINEHGNEQYWAKLDTPFNAAGGVTYFLSIYNNGAGDAGGIWAWAWSSQVGSGAFRSENPDGDWMPTTDAQAFQLVVPEPATAVLAALGFGIALLILRIRSGDRNNR